MNDSPKFHDPSLRVETIISRTVSFPQINLDLTFYVIKPIHGAAGFTNYTSNTFRVLFFEW